MICIRNPAFSETLQNETPIWYLFTKMDCFILENPTKMDDLRAPLSLGNPHLDGL